MNANASGMPPKFAATPENVVSTGADPRGRSLADRRVGDEEPEHSAEQRGDEADLDARLVRVDVWVVEEQADVREGRVVALSWNAPTRTAPAGTNRNAIAYAKKGSVPSQARDRRLRPDTMSGRSA